LLNNKYSPEKIKITASIPITVNIKIGALSFSDKFDESTEKTIKAGGISVEVQFLILFTFCIYK
jgi:hypothetical protein